MTSVDTQPVSIQPRFPRVLSSDAAIVLDINRQLHQFSRLEAGEQLKMLNAQMAHLLTHARSHSPFWAERIGTGSLGLATLKDIPPLTRSELQTRRNDIAAQFPGKDQKRLQIARTSGSTGIPVEVEKLAQPYMRMYSAVTLMDASWHGFDPRKPLGIINAKAKNKDVTPPYPPFCWYGPVANGFELCSRDVEIGEIYDYCIQKRPGYLRTGPHVLDQLARYALETGRRELQVESCFTVGWEISPEMRDIVRRGLGSAVNDRYSCEETGWIALQCPKHHHQHVITPFTYVEIVDDAWRHCPPGVPGRVLLTSLHSYAMPIIRYDVGDIAEWGLPCDCRITLPVIGKLWGRTRNVITTPEGRRTPAKFYFENFADIEGLKGFRFVLHQNHMVVAQIETTAPSPEADALIINRIHSALRYPYPVRILHVERIDWGNSWKQEYFAVSDAPAPDHP